ncbi:uncharacterized protein LOC143083262 [Mytilus galloprovincialis]|uniref:uncharacterized protein LOC143083262 n=1 Tax=Mytilus galloprovincialis TaxID=29158 RepID=UPI003F7C22FA
MESIKICIVGDGACGKSALLQAMMKAEDNYFLNHYIPTVFENYTFMLNYHGVDTTLLLCDTAGQEDYDRLRPLSFLGTDIVLVAFAVVSPASFENVEEKWFPTVYHFLKNVPRILVGIKSDLRNDKTVLTQLKKMKQVPVQQNDIEKLCKKHNLQYFETSAKTGDGVEACLLAAVSAGLAYHQRKNRIPVDLRRNGLQYAKHFLRPFVVDKILPAIKKDWVAFGVFIGYNKDTLKLARYQRLINPIWQVLRHWTETIAEYYIYTDHIKILYKGLSKVNKSLKRDLLEWIVRDSQKFNIQEIKEYLNDKDCFGFERVQDRLKYFKFSKDDQIPLTIWKMGKEVENQYRDVLRSGVEKRYVIRLPIVGPFSVGKTCLTRRLLRKEISDVTSTNGIEIMTQKCKVCLTDDTWIFSNDIRFDANQGRKSRLIKNLLVPPLREKTNTNKTAELTYMHVSAMNVSEKDDKYAITNSNDKRDEIAKKPSDLEINEEKKRKTNVLTNVNDNYENTEKINSELQDKVISPAEVTRSDLFADLQGWSESEASLDDFAEVALLDFAGQYEFYATHQTFLNKHAIYLLVLDVSKNIKGLMTSEYIEENFLDLSEIPFEDIGEYINFWMDAIHCYGDEEEGIDDTKEALPSIIVVGTCCDKLQISKETRKWEIQKQFDQILGDHPKRKHIKDFIMLSNTTSTESDFDVLRRRIVQLASKVETWGQQLPTRWIKYEQVLDQHRENQDRVMAYEDMKTLGKSVGLEIKDGNELNLFLKYQHDIGNLIYFEDIPDLVILQPQWLVDVLKCLVSARKFQIQRNIVYNSDWKELETTGRLTEDLITQAFTGEGEGTDFIKYRRHILQIMEKFDIIVKPDIPEEESVSSPEEKEENDEIKKSKLPVYYYVPCLIKSKAISNIVDSFNVDGQDFNRTSWMCMHFDFLPPAFFNHVLVNYIRRYQISREPSKHGCKLALYRGMGVFNLDLSGRIKLAVCVSKHVILFQIWKWGSNFKLSFKGIWEHAEASIAGIKGRYKMNVSYTVKMKCCNGSFDNPDGMVEMSKLETEEEYLCDEHAVLHKSKDLLESWFKEELNDEMLNYVRLAKTVTDLMPEVMVEQLKSDGFELTANTSMTFRSLFTSFQLQNKHKPTNGKWASRMCPNEDTEIGVGDDVKRWRFVLNELKSHSKISHESIVGLEKVLANVFLRSEKLFESCSFFSKYQKIMTDMFEANDYDVYLQKVKHEIIPDTFEVNIRRHFQMIMQEICVGKILDQMMTHCMLSIEDRRHIEQHVKQTEQNQALLDIIINRNRSTFNVFIDALRESGYDDIVELLSCDLEDTTVDTRTSQMEGLSAWTVPLHKVRLQKNYVDIISTIKHEAIVDHLISCELLTIDDQQIIEACPAQTEKNRKLMDRLLHCGEKCFMEFLNALRSDDVYADLANQIEHTDVTSIEIASLQSCYAKM